ncbi:hypothetical protein, partial [Collinsella sp. wc0583]|uniref:hypothetical protein n=1 Tax=Collinsella sp. wc0583 TaxID=3385507 RepID=UPI0038F64935
CRSPDPRSRAGAPVVSVPLDWVIVSDGACVADGSGTFARECFCEGAEVFLDLCRDAVDAAELHQWN